MHSPSESDVSSSSPSKDYYVESPSRDSQDDTDKSSSSNGGSGGSPSDSPSLPRSSTSTAASQISVPPRARRWNKHYCDVVREDDEDDYDDGDGDEDSDYYGDDAATRHCRRLMILTAVGFLFVVAVSAVWGTARAYKPQLSVKSLSLESLKRGHGSDHTGVPTSFLSVKCTTNVTVTNPATFFGIHVTTSYVNLLFYRIIVATGQMEKYYQPKKSERSMSVEVAGHEVPLYGAVVPFAAAANGDNRIPFTLEVGIESFGYLVGKLINTKHTRHVSCFLIVNPIRNRTIYFDHNSCKYT